MRKIGLVIAACAASSCAALRTGWARVTWLDGAERAETILCHRSVSDGDNEITCGPVLPEDVRTIWEIEARRVSGGNET